MTKRKATARLNGKAAKHCTSQFLFDVNENKKRFNRSHTSVLPQAIYESQSNGYYMIIEKMCELSLEFTTNSKRASKLGSK